MNKQRGFTIIELAAAIGSLLSLALFGLAVWAVCHFVAKYW